MKEGSMKKSERNLLVLLGTILLFALPYLYSSLNLGEPVMAAITPKKR